MTDANVVLGRVDPAGFAGGTMTLDVDAARQAIAALGEELGLDTPQLAEGICDVINAKMAQAIRTLTVEKGIEPRDFAMVAFGGAGPMHAAFLAAELEIADVIVPPFPGVFSAWGMLEAELRKDASRAYFTPLAALDRDDLAGLLSELEADGLDALETEGVAADARRVRHAIDLRYAGQEYSLTIPLESAGEPRGEDFHEVLSARFDAAHETRFGHANPGAPIELVTVRSTALGDVGRAEPEASADGAGGDVPDATRTVIFGRAAHEARALRREDLHAGAVLEGPAIVEEDTATTVVPPGATLRVVEHGALLIRLDTEATR